MKNKSIILILFLLTTLTSIFAQKYVEYYFRVPFENQKKTKELNEICSIDKIQGQDIYAYANPKEFAKVIINFPKYQLLTNPSKELEIPLAQSIDEMREWDSYPTYSTYISMMEDFATNYPNLCSVESIGTSVDNREILVAKISDNVGLEEAEPKFFYSGQMHGDEIVCSILFLRLIDYLLENYSTDTEIAQIINNTQIYINPLSNPDGLYTDDDNSIYGATRYNANGVDLNRNFPTPTGDNHPDDNPWQVENIAMMDFAAQHNFVMSSNSHSGAVVVNYPWDTWSRLHTDDAWLQFVSRIYADTVHENAPSPYMTDFDDGITNGYAWYQTLGSRQDWFTYDRNCKEITIELSFNKTVPANQLNDHWNYNYQSMIEWLKQVNYGIQGLISDQAGNPVEAKIEILNHDLEADRSFVYSSPLYGDYYRPIIAGNYDMKVSAEGFETQIIEAIQVENNSATEINVTLTQATLTSLEGYVYNENSEAISQASISLVGSSTYNASSNSSGYFTLDNIYTGQYTITISANGYQTYIQDLQVTADSEPLDIYMNESTAISFENELTEDWVSTSGISWTRTSDQAYDGNFSLKSSPIGNDATSDIQITIESQQAMISFYYRVSSEEDYDFLNFYINGNLQAAWSGEIDWTYAEFPVPAGENNYRWVYEKDGYVQEGSDCAWIDFVQLPSSTGNESSDMIAVHDYLSCYPNPFNPQVNISFYQSKDYPVNKISIYNLKGQKVTDLSTKDLDKGYQSLVWNGIDSKMKQVSSGIYFVVIDNGNTTLSRKIILMK